MKKICTITCLILTALVLSVQPGISREYVLTGQTMGTFYRIKFISAKSLSKALWQKKIDIRLQEVNARLSMYQRDSEISRFNSAPAHTPFRVSRDFYRVLVQCREIHDMSRGAWDGTVKPLVDLWGFGTKGRTVTLPSPDAIQSALGRSGFRHLTLGDRTLTKTAPGITLDLGSIAKGYGVDEIARLLAASGIRNYLVEIGGELVGAGRNKHGKPWAVGISNPEKSIGNSGLYRVVALDNMAIATSGNYRNFFELNGKTYAHIINPETGYPVDNMVVSASVVAENCTLADGLATALMVMETEAALALVDGLDRTECLVIRKEENALVPYRSKGFSGFELN